VTAASGFRSAHFGAADHPGRRPAAQSAWSNRDASASDRTACGYGHRRSYSTTPTALTVTPARSANLPRHRPQQALDRAGLRRPGTTGSSPTARRPGLHCHRELPARRCFFGLLGIAHDAPNITPHNNLDSTFVWVYPATSQAAPGPLTESKGEESERPPATRSCGAGAYGERWIAEHRLSERTRELYEGLLAGTRVGSRARTR